MDWFNYVGLIFVTVIMIPNIIYMKTHTDCFNNIYHNKAIETLEQIGRYGSFILMVFNIPYTYFGLFFPNAFLTYIIVGSILVFLYVLVWIICWNKHLVFRSYALSIIPSVLFIFTGVMFRSILLIICSLIFSYAHITISLKNAYKLTK